MHSLSSDKFCQSTNVFSRPVRLLFLLPNDTTMASIDEPFLLSSYSIDNEATHDPYVLQASRLVYVTNNDGKASQTKQKAHRSVAVVSVQRNGVHLIDVSCARSGLSRCRLKVLLTRLCCLEISYRLPTSRRWLRTPSAHAQSFRAQQYRYPTALHLC